MYAGWKFSSQGDFAALMVDHPNPKKKSPRPTGTGATSASPAESFTISDIEKLFTLMRENDIGELEIEQFSTKVHIVSKSAPVVQQQVVSYLPAGAQPQMLPVAPAPESQPAAQAQPPAAPTSSDAAGAAKADPADSLPANAITVLSPMVGTFYRSPSPEADAFVREGDVVNEDTVLCIVEAMKLMNEIKAETRGKIIRILVENGNPVEFNQPLFILEP